MKIVYDDNEKEKLEELYEILPVKLFDDPNRLYGITFKVTNPSLAQYILISLMNNKLEELDLGIDVYNINFNMTHDKRYLKEKLHMMIDEIIDSEDKNGN